MSSYTDVKVLSQEIFYKIVLIVLIIDFFLYCQCIQDLIKTHKWGTRVGWETMEKK